MEVTPHYSDLKGEIPSCLRLLVAMAEHFEIEAMAHFVSALEWGQYSQRMGFMAVVGCRNLGHPTQIIGLLEQLEPLFL